MRSASQRFVLGALAASFFSVGAARSGSDNPCGGIAANSREFLSCVVDLVERNGRQMNFAPALLTEPVRGNLATLATTLGYAGSAEDIERLKSRSREFKRDPVGNSEAIAVLDAAIASHIDEFRAIGSAALAAERLNAPPGTKNIFPDFVRQKLAYFDSDKAKFYDGGALEIAVRTLRANALEEAYFLDRAGGSTDNAKLRRSLAEIQEILHRLASREFRYLPTNQINTYGNDYRFAEAMILFALNEKEKARVSLKSLADNNREFGLGKPIDHIYISKLFSQPAVISVLAGRDKDGHPVVQVEESQKPIRRFFNPAQLALFVCARLDAAEGGIGRLSKDVSELVLSDYYVVIASNDNRRLLEEFKAELEIAMADPRLGELRKKLLELVGLLELPGFSESMRKGAHDCNVEDNVRDRIYSPLVFKPQVSSIEGFGKHKFHLLVGGHINAAQARTIADFINKGAFSLMRKPQEKGGGDNAAYIARTRIDG